MDNYSVEIEFLNDIGFIEILQFDNVSYVCFKYYNASIYLTHTKQMLTFKNVLNIYIKKK